MSFSLNNLTIVMLSTCSSRDRWSNWSVLGETASLCNRRINYHLYSWWSCRKQLHRKPVSNYTL